MASSTAQQTVDALEQKLDDHQEAGQEQQPPQTESNKEIVKETPARIKDAVDATPTDGEEAPTPSERMREEAAASSQFRTTLVVQARSRPTSSLSMRSRGSPTGSQAERVTQRKLPRTPLTPSVIIGESNLDLTTWWSQDDVDEDLRVELMSADGILAPSHSSPRRPVEMANLERGMRTLSLAGPGDTSRLNLDMQAALNTQLPASHDGDTCSTRSSVTGVGSISLPDPGEEVDSIIEILHDKGFSDSQTDLVKELVNEGVYRHSGKVEAAMAQQRQVNIDSIDDLAVEVQK